MEKENSKKKPGRKKCIKETIKYNEGCCCTHLPII
jgi:hypothetical protein